MAMDHTLRPTDDAFEVDALIFSLMDRVLERLPRLVPEGEGPFNSAHGVLVREWDRWWSSSSSCTAPTTRTSTR